VVLLTGATGFVGKVVLENLLRQREEFGIVRVHVLIRSGRRGEEPQARFVDEIVASPCFDRLAPGWDSLVRVVPGELTEGNCGIPAELRESLAGEVTHIVHCAASIEFDLPLEDAASQNITSALNVLALARECRRLENMVSISTAYVRPHPGDRVPVLEDLVELPFDPAAVYEDILAGRAEESALLEATGHPNTYTLTKCITEHLLVQNAGDVRLSIVRPSIVSATWQHPMPGWIDSKAAFAGFVVLIGLGLMRALAANRNCVLDVVPCDAVAERVTDTAFRHRRTGSEVVIRHAVAGVHRGLRIDACVNAFTDYFRRNPVLGIPGVPVVSEGGWVFRFREWLNHQGPVDVASLLMWLGGKGRKVRRMRKAIAQVRYLNEAFPYFTRKTFRFHVADPIAIPGMEPKAYIENVCEGVSRHLLGKEHEERLLAGKRLKEGPRDLRWAISQPEGNLAIRSSGYVVRKVFRRLTDQITFNAPSFEDAARRVDPDHLIVVVPTHRSYMDFVLASYLFFSRPDLRVPIPHIAAASEFSNLPFLGWLFKQTKAFYIRRGGGKADPRLAEDLSDLIEKNGSLKFYIEGTRSRSRQFLPPKRGIVRALQSAGVTATILPVAISYDRIPEEVAFLTELRGAEKPRMHMWPLLRWVASLIRGKINIGRVHLECGEPILLTPDSDARAVSTKVVGQLQERTVASTYHLGCFIASGQAEGVDVETLAAAIEARGGHVIKSDREVESDLDPLLERTLRYQWSHWFYADSLLAFPKHPVVVDHCRRNGYLDVSSLGRDDDPAVQAVVRALMDPVCEDRIATARVILGDSLEVFTAAAVVRDVPGVFLPNAEDALRWMEEGGYLARGDVRGTWVPGPQWNRLEASAETWSLPTRRRPLVAVA
jgi:1-acyl-sn-glycerol-3-phosphate acyltransferase